MAEVLRWPFRIVLYAILYIVWSSAALLILALSPGLSGIEAINILPAGWIPIAAAFFVDLYYSQLRGRKAR